MGNKGPKLVLKQGNDRNLISPLQKQGEGGAGTKEPLEAPNLTSFDAQH